MNSKCENCSEQTKFPVGFRDGAGNNEYEMSGGYVYDCNNIGCPEKQKRDKIAAEKAAIKALAISENAQNDVDIAALRKTRLKRGLNMHAMAGELDVSAVPYSRWESQSESMPPRIYSAAIAIAGTLNPR